MTSSIQPIEAPPSIGILSSDQLALQEVATEFAAERLAPNAMEWDREKFFPVEVLREAAELGMGGIYIAEDLGGSGLSRFDAAVIIEALATGDPSIASYLSIHNMVASMIDRYGDDDQRGRWLPDLCSMAVFGSYCLTEPGAGSDAAALSTRATKTSDGWTLNGVKQFISGAGTSGVYVVMARTADSGSRGITAFVVEKDTPGLSFGPNEYKMGWNAQPTRQVIFDDVQVSSDHLLGAQGQGFAIAMTALDGGRINIGASSLGGGSTALDKAISYLADRKAFGAPLLESQALQFRLADMHTQLESARGLLWRAAAALDAKAPDMTVLCAMAKRLATDTGFTVANDSLQMLGGYGYLAEYGVEKIVRDLRVHQILEGTNEIMRLIIARHLTKAQNGTAQRRAS